LGNLQALKQINDEYHLDAMS